MTLCQYGMFHCNVAKHSTKIAKIHIRPKSKDIQRFGIQINILMCDCLSEFMEKLMRSHGLPIHKYPLLFSETWLPFPASWKGDWCALHQMPVFECIYQFKHCSYPAPETSEKLVLPIKSVYTFCCQSFISKWSCLTLLSVGNIDNYMTT